jgi:hypothetical protein
MDLRPLQEPPASKFGHDSSSRSSNSRPVDAIWCSALDATDSKPVRWVGDQESLPAAGGQQQPPLPDGETESITDRFDGLRGLVGAGFGGGVRDDRLPEIGAQHVTRVLGDDGQPGRHARFRRFPSVGSAAENRSAKVIANALSAGFVRREALLFMWS